MNKIPLLVEIVGENAVGKTHTSLLFPKAVLFDFTPEGEGEVIAVKLGRRYFRIGSYDEFIKSVNELESEVKTVVIDTSKDFVRVMADEWIKQENLERKSAGKSLIKRVYPVTSYGEVYNMVDLEIRRLMKFPRNVVMTSIMADEYIEDKRTGNRKRDGYSRLPFSAWLRFAIEIKDGKRVYKVLKNRFVDIVSDKYVRSFEWSKGLDFWEKVKEISFGVAGIDKSFVVE